MKVSTPEQQDMALIIKHVRHMLSARDGFSVLVRGMVLIDQTLDLLLDGYLAISLKKVKSAIPQLTLNGKAALALAVGAIDSEEHAFIRKCNGLRNRVAHRLNADVTLAEEKEIVASYDAHFVTIGQWSSSKKLTFPQALALALIFASTKLRFRAEALEKRRLAKATRESRSDAAASFGFVLAVMRLANEGGEPNSERIKEVVRQEVRTVVVGLRIVEVNQRKAKGLPPLPEDSTRVAGKRRRYPRQPR